MQTRVVIDRAAAVRDLNMQFTYVVHALRNSYLLALVLWWIVGNACFATLYDYEVSIYQELNGSADWNGSVLAILLLVGALGSVVPTWLQV